MSDTIKTYQDLLAYQKQTALLESIAGVLEWDERTYLPEGGAEHRAEQISHLSGMTHRRSTDPVVDEMLRQLSEPGRFSADSVESANIREWRRAYDKAVKLPAEFVEEMSKLTMLAQSHWREARREKDFSRFEPWLTKIVDMKRREADLLGWEEEPYDALLDAYEPGAKTAEIAAALTGLCSRIVPMLAAIQASGVRPDTSILKRHFPAAEQEAFSKQVADAMGFNFHNGRLDSTTHPFCTGLGPSDVRITTRYDENFINAALFGVMHEAGHAIYEQNLPREHYGTPCGWSVSLGIHESQSRLWENFVGRSRPFWEGWFAIAQKRFVNLSGCSLDDFYFAINEVSPSFIRVEADEMTYNLHILLRFEIERELVSGRLAVKEVPHAWNSRFYDYFGLQVPDDAQGCLQDIHWSAGYVGYFPTYSLGNLNAAQLYAKARADISEFDDRIRAREYKSLREWLTENIHRHGRRFTGTELIQRVTGKPLQADDLIDYLQEKFGGLYGISFR